MAQRRQDPVRTGGVWWILARGGLPRAAISGPRERGFFFFGEEGAAGGHGRTMVRRGQGRQAMSAGEPAEPSHLRDVCIRR